MAEPEKTSDALDPNSMLIAEFEYIAQTAFQANEDRARVSTFYFVSVGSLLAAVFTLLNQDQVNPNLMWAFFFLFLGLAVYGVLTVVQIAGLRLAWFASAQAMNRIKDYYISQARVEGYEQAFAWRLETLPRPLKLTSVTVLSAVQVATLSGILAGTAVAYWYLLQGNAAWLMPAVGTGVALVVVQLVILVLMLRRPPHTAPKLTL